MTQPVLKPVIVGLPVATPQGGMTPELAETMQRLYEYVRALEARVAALEP